jgi:hypothetical protein
MFKPYDSDRPMLPRRPPLTIFHGCMGDTYRPVRYTPTEAWWLVNGTWMPIHPADVANDASILTEDYYNDMYPNLPALPPEAFTQ